MQISKRIIALLLPVAFIPQIVLAQLTVDTTLTPQQLVKDVLVGNGVQVSNVTYTGSSEQIGFFDATNANLMTIDSGVIMSSGRATFAIGPNDQTNGTDNPTSGTVDGDPDLYQANGGINVNDVAIIEFDFVPKGDTIEFDYVFGSDEYMTYAGGSINDVFGFFVSGPGISGPYTNNAVNIATIPTTGGPVTLNSVNADSNSSFYVNNGDGYNATPPPPNYDTDSAYIQYDGHTVVMTAKRAVMCDSTYHFKLAIGDGSDDIIDSGVFLKANSLTSRAVTVNTDINVGKNDSTIFEGCGSASFDLLRKGDTSMADTVYVETSGSATEGSDYTSLPDSVFYAPGDDSTTLTLDALADGVSEGIESVFIDVIYRDPSACSIWDTSRVEVYIDDPDSLQLSTSADTFVGACSDSVQIWAAASGGYGDYQWKWNTGVPNGDSTGMVAPNSKTTYVVDVSDTCAVNSATDSITVDAPSFNSLKVHTYNDTTYVCPSESVPIGIDSISGGSGNATFYWDSLGTDSSYMVNPNGTTTFKVTAVDTCLDDTAIGTVTVTKGFSPLQITAGQDTTICAGSDGRLYVAQQSGGTGDVTYEWQPGGYTGESKWFTSDTIDGTSKENSYTVTATDSCGVSVTDSMTITRSSPIASFIYESKVQETESPFHFISTSQNAMSYWWDFGYKYYSAIGEDTVLSYPKPGRYEVVHVARDKYGCTDTTRQYIKIDPPFNLYVPNAFTPDGDGVNDVFRAHGAGMETYKMEIYNRWGKMIYRTKEVKKGWDGTINGDPAPSGVYVYKFTVKGKNGETKKVEGHVTLIR